MSCLLIVKHQQKANLFHITTVCFTMGWLTNLWLPLSWEIPAMINMNNEFIHCQNWFTYICWSPVTNSENVTIGIYYSQHNYELGHFVSQSIRNWLFIHRPVMVLQCSREFTHTEVNNLMDTWYKCSIFLTVKKGHIL